MEAACEPPNSWYESSVTMKSVYAYTMPAFRTTGSITLLTSGIAMTRLSRRIRLRFARTDLGKTA